MDGKEELRLKSSWEIRRREWLQILFLLCCFSPLENLFNIHRCMIKEIKKYNFAGQYGCIFMKKNLLFFSLYTILY